MDTTSKVAKNLQAFQIGVNAHDQNNECTAWGIGLAHFDLERLGFDEGETILPGIVVQTDGGMSGNFRILCDGGHEELEEEAESSDIVEAVSTTSVSGDQYTAREI
ncbi:MAG TPA: hypothetical protein VFB41_06375 [Solirubrobacteraceae bacterium]|nr:hypothetical protein [Solirubrobacteraceae bacterium]